MLRSCLHRALCPASFRGPPVLALMHPLQALRPGSRPCRVGTLCRRCYSNPRGAAVATVLQASVWGGAVGACVGLAQPASILLLVALHLCSLGVLSLGG